MIVCFQTKGPIFVLFKGKVHFLHFLSCSNASDILKLPILERFIYSKMPFLLLVVSDSSTT